MNIVVEPEMLNRPLNEPKTGKQILFVCTGNTCRSPMAAALYNARYAGDGSRAFSAGLAADGSGISENAALALQHAGVLSTPDNGYLSHVSRTVTETMLEKADLVVGITGRHTMQLLFAAPAYASRITSLPTDIPDPYGGDLAMYKACLAQIDTALREMFVLSAEGESHDEL